MGLQKTEWQVIEKEGVNIVTGLTKREAEREFAENIDAETLVKVVWKCHEGETWETDNCIDEWQRVETIKLIKGEKE